VKYGLYFDNYCDFSTQHASPNGRTPAPTNYPYNFYPYEQCSYCSDPYHSASNGPSWGQFYNFFLVCDWLHSVGRNHFYVVLLFNQGYRLIQSLLFRDVLQVDSAYIPSQRSRIPRFRLDVPVNRPDAHQSSNIRPDDVVIPSGLPSMYRSFELFKVAFVWTSQQHVQTPFNVRQVKDFLCRHRYGKTVATIWTTDLHRLDAILDKARCGEDLRPFG
jgi:hypothetical protein